MALHIRECDNGHRQEALVGIIEDPDYNKCKVCGSTKLKTIPALCHSLRNLYPWQAAEYDLKPANNRYDKWRKTEGEQGLREGKYEVPSVGSVKAETDTSDPYQDYKIKVEKETKIEQRLDKTLTEVTPIAEKIIRETGGDKEKVKKARAELHI